MRVLQQGLDIRIIAETEPLCIYLAMVCDGEHDGIVFVDIVMKVLHVCIDIQDDRGDPRVIDTKIVHGMVRLMPVAVDQMSSGFPGEV